MAHRKDTLLIEIIERSANFDTTPLGTLSMKWDDMKTHVADVDESPTKAYVPIKLHQAYINVRAESSVASTALPKLGIKISGLAS